MRPPPVSLPGVGRIATKVTGLRLRVGAGGTKTWIFRARVGERTINKKLGSYPGMDLTEARTAALKLVSAITRGGSAVPPCITAGHRIPHD